MRGKTKVIRAIVLGLVLTASIALPSAAQGPIRGAKLRAWERRCLQSTVCRSYAYYSYDNYLFLRDLGHQAVRGYHAFVGDTATLLTPTYARR